MSLGIRIKELRRAKGLTQRQLAELVKVNFTYISKIENDQLEHTPSLQTLQDLAEHLKADELELIRLANKMPPVFEGLSGNQAALQFFRRASSTVRSPEEWDGLHDYLDQLEQKRKD